MTADIPISLIFIYMLACWIQSGVFYASHDRLRVVSGVKTRGHPAMGKLR